jgi:hypothetical protein
MNPVVYTYKLLKYLNTLLVHYNLHIVVLEFILLINGTHACETDADASQQQACTPKSVP